VAWQGLTNKDIPGVLFTSEQVVKNYLCAPPSTSWECGPGGNSRSTWPDTAERTGTCNWGMGCCRRGAGRSVAAGEETQFSGSSGISSTIKEKRSASKRRPVVGKRRCRSLDLSHALIPVVQQRLSALRRCCQQETEILKRPNSYPGSYAGSCQAFIPQLFPSNAWGRKQIAHWSLYPAVRASRWFCGVARPK
jgi:hypothetical protein